MTTAELRELRRQRDALARHVREAIEDFSSPALERRLRAYLPMPNWWPGALDALKRDVRALYRLGMEVRNAEYRFVIRSRPYNVRRTY